VKSEVCIALHPKVIVVGACKQLRERAKSQVSTLYGEQSASCYSVRELTWSCGGWLESWLP